MSRTEMSDKKVQILSHLAKEMLLPVAGNIVCDQGLHAEDVPYFLIAGLILALQKLREVRKENAEHMAQDCIDSLSLSLTKTGFPVKAPGTSGTVGMAQFRPDSKIILAN